MRDDQRAQGIIGHNAPGVADDVSISFFQAQSASRKTSIHAGQDRELALRARRELAQFVRARVNFVGGENFINDAHEFTAEIRWPW